MHGTRRRPPAIASRSSRCCARSCRARYHTGDREREPASTRCISRPPSPNLDLAAVRSECRGARQHRGPYYAAGLTRSCARPRDRCGVARLADRTADAIVCINMIHIAPWSAAEGLMAGAARLQRCRSSSCTDHIAEHGAHTAPSNEAFDSQSAGGRTRRGACATSKRSWRSPRATASRSTRRVAMPADQPQPRPSAATGVIETLASRSSAAISGGGFSCYRHEKDMADADLKTPETTETHSFQAEVAELLRLMVHSVYSETDVFLRELDLQRLGRLRPASLRGDREAGADRRRRAARDPPHPRCRRRRR